ncbi:MAG TPA: methionine biosynthesis protein MetW [Spirochaetota bacterium]|nr:methionine biosynthesis protein MetW [Spirochaetota bacterium]
MEELRIGYDLVVDAVNQGAKILDLGCGDGELLLQLQEEKKVKGFGVEISEEGVSLCMEKGLYCYQADIDEGLSDYKDDSFDFVILSQTIQNTKVPDYVLSEVLRIGKQVIVSFPNFGYYRNRIYLLFRGKMPVSKHLPYEWYESPNIHLMTIHDMRNMAGHVGFKIIKERNFSVRDGSSSKRKKFMPNFFAQYGFFIIRRK